MQFFFEEKSFKMCPSNYSLLNNELNDFDTDHRKFGQIFKARVSSNGFDIRQEELSNAMHEYSDDTGVEFFSFS